MILMICQIAQMRFRFPFENNAVELWMRIPSGRGGQLRFARMFARISERMKRKKELIVMKKYYS